MFRNFRAGFATSREGARTHGRWYQGFGRVSWVQYDLDQSSPQRYSVGLLVELRASQLRLRPISFDWLELTPTRVVEWAESNCRRTRGTREGRFLIEDQGF